MSPIRFLVVALVALGALALPAAAQAGPAQVPPEQARYHDGAAGRFLLNGTWLFRRDKKNVGERQRYFAQTSTSGWRNVSVPHAWNAKDTSNASMAGSVSWYRKDFRAPAGPATAWLLRFDNVRYRATVWLNGKKVGGHAGAYIPWELRAKAFRPNGLNRLVVRVDNHTRATDIPPARLTLEGAPNGGWWNYGGILGDVYLRRVQGLDFSRVQVRPLLSCRTCAATIAYRVDVRNYSSRAAPVTVTSTYGDRSLNLGTRTIKAGRTATFFKSLKIAQPHLWSPNDPYLYEATLSATGGGGTAGYQLLSGVRSVTVKKGRLLLNGAPVHFRGFFMHEDDPNRGGAAPHEREDLFVKLTKDVAGTVLRTHYPFSPYMHELADRNGIMIWSEIPVYQVPRDVLDTPSYRRKAARMLKDNIIANGNHPSVFTWSIGNEIRGRPAAPEARYFRDQAKLVKKLDKTRPVALAVAGYTSVGCLRGPYKPIELMGLNSYFGWYQGPGGELADRDNLSGALDYLHRCHPKKALVVTEFGAEANRSGPAEERGTYAFQSELYDFHLRVYAKKPWLGGAMGTLQTFKCRPHWNGGNPRPTPPYHDKGIFDYFGNAKPSAAVISDWFHKTVQYGP